MASKNETYVARKSRFIISDQGTQWNTVAISVVMFDLLGKAGFKFSPTLLLKELFLMV